MSKETLSILIIEDSTIMLEIANVFLKDHDLTTSKTAKKGLEHYEANLPDIVFLDIGLPDGNGHEVLQKIKKINIDAFVIIVTGSRETADFQESVLEGAQGYLVKPFSKKQMLECIDLYHEYIK